ncbi:CPBP family intramembrane glutamic endopeptidase [Pseudotenacibaculum haliotis]|uniref:CPBP family intramembrane glutamic endopeptidase n=1 Tax=Pseudotenacibaculum haliotis TaxID=1862138 RepID=A0ABW5LTJ3_9FLAO
MNKISLKATLIPVITIILCCLLYLFGYFQMTFAAILMIIASAIEYKKDLFRSLGFQRKKIQVKRLFIIVPIVGLVFFLFYYYVMIPGATYLTRQPIDFSVFEPYEGNLPATLSLLVLIWVSAAFAEEIVFRGYLMRQFTKFFGSGKVSLVINILLFGFLFGWLHAYQGLTGQIVSGVTGMLLAIVFHLRKNDLWLNIALHGFIDTAALFFMYTGWL